MKSLVGVFISIFGFIATFVIMIMVIRLSIGKSAFVSISQIYHSISDIDLLRSFNTMIEHWSECINDFTSASASFGTISDLGSFFYVLGNFIPKLWDLLTMPISIVYYLCWFIYDLWTLPYFLIRSLLV